MDVLIVGGGRVGAYLAGLLLAGRHGVALVEQEASEVERLRRELPAERVLLGSGTEPEVLRTAGIERAGAVAAVTGADETNLVVTSLARFEFKVPRTIARVNDPRNAWMFSAAMGVDVALNPPDLLAHLIVEEMSLGEMAILLKLRRGQYALVEERVHPDAPAAGKTLAELDLPARCVITAVLRGGELVVPRPDLRLQAADELIALVHTNQTRQLAELLAGS